MKKCFFNKIFTFVITILFTCCNKLNDAQDKTTPVDVALEVVNIEDNCATIKSSIISGSAYTSKMIFFLPESNVSIDYSVQEQLAQFVKERGLYVKLPLERKLTGIKVGENMFTAVIVYDDKGNVSSTKTCIWTPVGKVSGWSEETSPGVLDEIIW